MIVDKMTIRPRYSETDQMGYIYHGNYVTYCHEARTELLRKFGLHDSFLEENDIILPVIEMNLKYLKPAFYDAPITIITKINEIPQTRFKFEFEFRNIKNEKITQCNTTVVFVNKTTRKPMRVPEFVKEKLMAVVEN